MLHVSAGGASTSAGTSAPLLQIRHTGMKMHQKGMQAWYESKFLIRSSKKEEFFMTWRELEQTEYLRNNGQESGWETMP